MRKIKSITLDPQVVHTSTIVTRAKSMDMDIHASPSFAHTSMDVG
jgi:hypothetical protein